MHRCEYSIWKLLHEGRRSRSSYIEARREAECYMRLRDLPPSAIIYVEYERIRCINWFVVWTSSGVTAAFEKRQVKCPSVAPCFGKV